MEHLLRKRQLLQSKVDGGGSTKAKQPHVAYESSKGHPDHDYCVNPGSVVNRLNASQHKIKDAHNKQKVKRNDRTMSNLLRTVKEQNLTNQEHASTDTYDFEIYEGLEAEITMNVLKIKAEPSSDEEHSSLLDIELPNKKEIIETLPELTGEGNSLKEEFPQSIIEFEEVKIEKEEEYDETDKTEVAVSPEAVIMKKEKIEPTEDLQQLDCDSAVEFDVSSYTNRKASCGCEEDRETETSGNMCKSLYRFDVCRESNNQNEHLIKHERKLSEDILAYGSNSKESSWSRKTKGKFDVCQETAVYKNFEENQKTQSEHQINNYKASAKSCMYNTEFQTDETIQKEKMYSSCGVCGKIFATRYKLKQHQSSHNGMKPYTCSVCGKGFTARQNLKQHQWRHTGVKPYTCRVCSKDLTTKKNLKQHQWIHTGEKLYSCDICGKEFAQGSSLKRHQITHTGEKPFSCVVCGKTFGREKYLEEHEVIHTGEKPYSCDVCGKEFTRSSSLKIHQVSHSGKKPYSCSVCGKDFTRKFSLKRHEKIHNGKKLYCCNVCGKEFAQSSSVEKHQIMHSDKNMLCVKKSLEG
ncbi:zinc finger protein 260-like isoform X2 [Limulus polyphemus]|uniref:Zinc finger protein 260-like isoform X2 n=1 Tax=Limulus polyphemus TaxID=6850 RepID=A0ABM1SBZ3_LIMPO|nr:zinc finger protein 260-like isoform X2 [Limulus polyphemus]